MAKKPALPKDFLFSKETAEAMGCIARSGLIAESATRFWIEGDIPIESHEGRRYGWEISSRLRAATIRISAPCAGSVGNTRLWQTTV